MTFITEVIYKLFYTHIPTFSFSIIVVCFEPSHFFLPGLLWTCPEVLREAWEKLPPPSSSTDASTMEPLPLATMYAETQAADIYAAGVILKEVFCRNGPYTEFEDDYTPYGNS